MSTSIIDRQSDRDRVHDRRREIRDRILCALEDSGRQMTPTEIAHRTGLGAAAVTLGALRSPAYFVVARKLKTVVGIDRHPHLKIGA